ncbi:hypothetical protein FHT08_002825 [Xanthomonas campestris]|uniref:hypothetical protein n=1 Tax=Xanthomonas sp. CFBP 8151 TaxID=3035310 RepID=UPI00141B2114|nr:hypothetical protein [Xanthomonas sp. CFBP 8151]NIJ77742.1 hypothetical protein [Xanthomonas sp. CFBP 8151]
MKTSRGEKPTNEMIERVWAQVIQWIGELYLGPNKLTSKISLDISAIAERINFYIIFRGCERVDFSPNFPGCGIISSCDGDILADDVLIEVKAGGRKFRATDLRQLFIYSALAWKSRDTNIKSICLLNPRWGVAWTATLEDAAIGCGANSGVELAEDIVRGAILLGTSK